MGFNKIFPCLNWLKSYSFNYFSRDLVAAVIVTIMLIPQSLAYALLAGVPPQVGLYASILPLMLYAIFGTSKTLSVGPVAIASLMTAAAIQQAGFVNQIDTLNAAIMLAFLSGVFLLLMGILRFGFMANFLSHPVVSGFITASAIIIGLSQLKHILGIDASGANLIELVPSLIQHLNQTNLATVIVGILALAFLFWSRSGLKTLLDKLDFADFTTVLIVKASPVFIVIVSIIIAFTFDLANAGLALVGEIPSGLPSLSIPSFSNSAWVDLILPAILISVIGYVESISVSKTLAAKKRQRINPNQELIGLGAANLGSALSGGFPVTGGFSRSVVNFDAGAETPAASFLTAIGIALATFTLTGTLAYLPKAILAATIIVAVFGLIDFSMLNKAWQYSRSDFTAAIITIAATLLFGVEIGVLSGVVTSLGLHINKTSKPHIAEVGQIPGTEHFRNVKRHNVITSPEILSLRIDESLYFLNAAFLEDTILKEVAERKLLKHVILLGTAINEIDMSALEILESLNRRLTELNIGFHFSDVKGPVMDMLEKTDFLEQLNGQVFLSQNTAFTTLVEEEQKLAREKNNFQDFQI